MDQGLLEVAEPVVDVVDLGARVSSGREAQKPSSPSSTPRRVAIARRMSVKDRIQVIAAASSSSTSMNSPSSGSVGRPASSSVSMIAAAAAALPSRSVASVKRRKSPAASSSSG